MLFANLARVMVNTDMGIFQNFMEFQNFEGWQGGFLEISYSNYFL